MILEIDSTIRNPKKITLKEGSKTVATKTTDGDILVAIKNLLSEQNVELTQIEKVISLPEGDSMTGLRVGSAIANALNFATGKLADLKDLQFPNYKSPPKITLKK